jgi:hypothetical protein
MVHSAGNRKKEWSVLNFGRGRDQFGMIGKIKVRGMTLVELRNEYTGMVQLVHVVQVF